MAHSPGAWKAFLAGKSSNLAIGRDIGDDTYIVLARVSEVITGVGTPDANAALMAAAPDLLEACELIAAFYTMPTEEFVERFGHGISTRDVGDKARAAIAKARGSEGPVNK